MISTCPAVPDFPSWQPSPSPAPPNQGGFSRSLCAQPLCFSLPQCEGPVYMHAYVWAWGSRFIWVIAWNIFFPLLSLSPQHRRGCFPFPSLFYCWPRQHFCFQSKSKESVPLPYLCLGDGCRAVYLYHSVMADPLFPSPPISAVSMTGMSNPCNSL